MSSNPGPLHPKHSTVCPVLTAYGLLQVRDELERLLDDDDDMADLYLSRKLSSASPVSDSGGGAAGWFHGSPTIGSKISRASRASVMTVHGDENDVEELEMLLEVSIFTSFLFIYFILCLNWFCFFDFFQAYFMQIDGTLNKLMSVSHVNSLLFLFYRFLAN